MTKEVNDAMASIQAKMDEPIASPLEQRLKNDSDALELCRWWCAWQGATATHDDNDLSCLFDLFWDGVEAARNLTAGECAERLEDDVSDGQTIDEFLTDLAQARNEA